MSEPRMLWITAVPEGVEAAMIGQRYTIRDGRLFWLNAGFQDPSMWRSLAEMTAAGYTLTEVPAEHEGTSWHLGQEIEWNPTGDGWRSGVIDQLAGDLANIVLHENGQHLNVDTRHIRPRTAGVR